jgi:hypothetical protein
MTPREVLQQCAMHERIAADPLQKDPLHRVLKKIHKAQRCSTACPQAKPQRKVL